MPLTAEEQKELEQLKSQAAELAGPPQSEQPKEKSFYDLYPRPSGEVLRLKKGDKEFSIQQYSPEQMAESAVAGSPMGLPLKLTRGLGRGLGGIADWLSQKSVGMSKYIPGAGTELLEQGVWGTKKGMTEQAAKALSQNEGSAALGAAKKSLDAAESTPPNLSSDLLAAAAAQAASMTTLGPWGFAVYAAKKAAELPSVQSTGAKTLQQLGKGIGSKTAQGIEDYGVRLVGSQARPGGGLTSEERAELEDLKRQAQELSK